MKQALKNKKAPVARSPVVPNICFNCSSQFFLPSHFTTSFIVTFLPYSKMPVR